MVAPVIAGQATATRQVAAAWERRGSGVGALTSAVVNNVALVIIGQAERRWRCSTPAPPGSRRQGAHDHDRRDGAAARRRRQAAAGKALIIMTGGPRGDGAAAEGKALMIMTGGPSGDGAAARWRRQAAAGAARAPALLRGPTSGRMVGAVDA